MQLRDATHIVNCMSPNVKADTNSMILSTVTPIPADAGLNSDDESYKNRQMHSC